jgi:hypothetical protein
MQKLIALLFVAALYACNGSQDKQQASTNKSDSTQPNKPIEDRVLSPTTNLSPLFDSLRPATQTFTIKGDKDTLVTGHNGTTFSIVKNTFVNQHGQPAATVTLNLVEANSMAEIVKSNLQTTAGNNILQTGGMFFLDARENGKSLAIADGKSIAVEVRAPYNDPKMKIFEGKFDNKGKIDWNISGNLESNLIALPFNLLNFQQGGIECALSQEQANSITQPKFANTYLATREFELRSQLLNITSCEQYHGLEQKLLDIYVSNTDKPLFISDSLAADYLLKHNKAQIDTTRTFQLDEIGWITDVYQQLLTYTQQHFTNVIDFNKLGITDTTTPEELVSKGYTQADAEKYIACFRLRKQVIKTRKSQNKTYQLAAYSFSINKLGWINVDCFLTGQNTAISTFEVQTKSKDSLDYVSVSLVIPPYYVSVFAIHTEGKLHSFTKNKDGYRNLPVGEEALVVAFGYKDNKPWFGQQKITIPKEGRVTVELKPTTIAAIKRAILN